MAKVTTRVHTATGIIPAVLTPMRDDGSPDISLLVTHGRQLMDQGCTSIVVLGTTGEANSFTVLERKAILESVLARGIAPESLIVGTGCCAIGDTVDLTKHALSMSVARVLVLPPFYYKNVSDEGLFSAFATAIDRINDERLRLFIYLIPQMSGIEIGADLIERLHAAYPTVIAGLKDSSGRWESTGTLSRRLGSKIDVMVGTEALLLRAMDAGASGCITAIANVAARPIVRLYQQRGEATAASIERNVNQIRAAFETLPVIPALKAYLARSTATASWRHVRPPLCPLDATKTEHLLHKLDAIKP